MNNYTDMPKIVQIVGSYDAGEDGTRCPHCGAEGRYVTTFVCADGSRRGAMAGCFAKWPKHPFVTLHERILLKERANAKTGKKLASWDVDTLNAIERFTNGEIAEWEAKNITDHAAAKKQSWMRRRRF